ncbi:O-antigen polymerase [uncultured Veillonella sp.]|uniref:O-antigen polymerase n=1 Tax=uncultured Veillonella sp. TaxID=159268 RepID=UPI0028DC9556|nr:O-antigen polymerase [uncultured Veillonella sp.]
MVDSQFWFISLSLSSVLLLLVTLYALDFDLLSPVIATQSSLTIASILCTIMVKQWQLPMHGSTVILLITAQIVMTLGSLYVAHCLNDRSLVKATISSQSMSDVYIPIYRQCILWVLLGIILGLAGHEMYTLAEKAGNKNGILGIASSIRPYIMAESSTIKPSRWMAYYQILVQQITYLSIFVFIQRTVFKAWCWTNLCYLIPLLFFFPFVYLTTGRILVITLVIFIFTVVGHAMYRKYEGLAYAKKLLTTAGVSFVSFFLLFVVLGALFGKGISANKSAFEILAHYAGISLSAFDVILQYQLADSTLIGQTIFVGPYGNLNTLGFNLPKPSIFLFFTYFYNIDTNVYTSLMRYYHDFSLLGMYLFALLIILIYTILYYLCRQRNSIPMILAYATFVYPLYLFYVDDRIFIDFFGTQIIYVLVLQFILIKVLYKFKT